MCDECMRLQNGYQAAEERLRSMQFELAKDGACAGESNFHYLWDESVSALKELWNIRDEMTKHATSHSIATMSAHV